jgi:hypothetical protein
MKVSTSDRCGFRVQRATELTSYLRHLCPRRYSVGAADQHVAEAGKGDAEIEWRLSASADGRGEQGGRDQRGKDGFGF